MVHGLSMINKDIQFTPEIKINFLDFTMNIIYNKFDFNTYKRKPMQADTIIPNDSNHPYS